MKLSVRTILATVMAVAVASIAAGEGAMIVPSDSAVKKESSASGSITFQELVETAPPSERFKVLRAERPTTETEAVVLPEEMFGGVVESLGARGEVRKISLPEAISIALEHNFSLQNSQRDVEISYSRLRATRADYLPFANFFANSSVTDARNSAGPPRNTNTFSAGTGVDITQNLGTGGEISGSASTNRDRTRFSRDSGLDPDREFATDLELTLNQPLLRGGGFDVGLAPLRQSKLSRISSEIGDYMERRDTALSVIRTYYGVLQTRLNLRVSEDALKVKARFIDDAKVKFSLGEIPESEISGAEIQYLNEAQQYVRLKQDEADAIERLLNLLGLALDSRIDLEEISQNILDSTTVSIPELDRCLLEAETQRSELTRAQIGVVGQEISVRLAENGRLPDLNLTGRYSDRESGTNFSDTTGVDDNRVWSAGVSLNVPVPNIQRRESARQARLQLESAQNSYEITRRNVVNEIKVSYRQVKNREITLKILEKSVEQSRKSLELATGRFGFGLATSIDVRKAQDDFFSNQTNYNTALLNYQIDLAQLYVSLGRELF